MGGGYQWYSETSDHISVNPGWGILKIAWAIQSPVRIVADRPYLAVSVLLDPSRDFGPDECTGCDRPACILVQAIELYQEVGSPGGDILILDTPATRQFITWQGGDIGGRGCPLQLPAHNKTWGAIKAIYR